MDNKNQSNIIRKTQDRQKSVEKFQIDPETLQPLIEVEKPKFILAPAPQEVPNIETK